MGADYKAVALIGIKISNDDLFYEQDVRAFPHNRPRTERYDSKTGQPLWTTEEFCHLENFGDEQWEDFDVIRTEDECYVCCLQASDTYSNGGNTEDMASLKKFDLESEKVRLKKALEKHKLWNEDNFGLWTVLQCSY